MKRQVDIEKLLSWAFLDELPKGGSEAWSPWERISTLGTRVDDQFGSIFRLPPIFGDPHPDAITISRHVDRLMSPARELVTHYAILNSHPRPLGQPTRVSGIKDGPHYQVSAKSLGRASKAQMELARKIGITEPIRLYPDGTVCPLRFEPTWEEVYASQAEWTAWLTGLQVLVLGLRGHLSEYWPVGPRWPLEPWNEAQVQRTVFYARA